MNKLVTEDEYKNMEEALLPKYSEDEETRTAKLDMSSMSQEAIEKLAGTLFKSLSRKDRRKFLGKKYRYSTDVKNRLCRKYKA